MINIITAVYRIICGIVLISTLPFLIKWFKLELQARKDRYEYEKEQIELRYRTREYPFPDTYYDSLRITSFIVVPRLPDPYTEEIQKLLQNGIGFILEAEYLCIIKDAPNFETMSYNVFCYDSKTGNPAWKQYNEYMNYSKYNIGRTYHPVTEIWSLAYLHYKESQEIPEGVKYLYTRTLPDHIKNAIDKSVKCKSIQQYTNCICLTNPTYHHIIKDDEEK